VSEEELQAFSRRHRIRKLGFFRSVSEDSDQFGPMSDVDVLVVLSTGHREASQAFSGSFPS
jgi:predicted nucleotidyltransferase